MAIPRGIGVLLFACLVCLASVGLVGAAAQRKDEETLLVETELDIQKCEINQVHGRKANEGR
jgi:hypothetical protein